LDWPTAMEPLEMMWCGYLSDHIVSYHMIDILFLLISVHSGIQVRQNKMQASDLATVTLQAERPIVRWSSKKLNRNRGARIVEVDAVPQDADRILDGVPEGSIKQDGEFKCVLCNTTYPTRPRFQNHYRTHTGEKPFNCTICNRQFADRSNWLKHTGKNGPHYVHRCGVCKKILRYRHSLELHMKNHLNTGCFVCHICNKRHARRFYLEKHLRTHSGERPFKCTYCDVRMADK